jgi:hypothetical protein
MKAGSFLLSLDAARFASSRKTRENSGNVTSVPTTHEPLSLLTDCDKLAEPWRPNRACGKAWEQARNSRSSSLAFASPHCLRCWSCESTRQISTRQIFDHFAENLAQTRYAVKSPSGPAPAEESPAEQYWADSRSSPSELLWIPAMPRSRPHLV